MIPRLMLMALAGKVTGTIATYYGELYKAIMDDSPLAYWRLGEPIGIEAYDEVGTYQGDLVNTPTLDVTGALSNSSDTAMTFASVSSEYVTMGDVLDFDYNEPFSLECWFKSDTAIASQTLMAKQGAVSPDEGYLLYQNATGYISFVLRNDLTTNKLVVTLNTAYDDNSWHHCIMTYDGSSNASGVTIYIDGNSEAFTTNTDTLSATTLNSIPFQIGARENTNLPWNGSIDDVAVYGVELTQSQVAHHYWAGKSAYADPVLSLNPLIYCRLGESSGTVAKDETGTQDGVYVNTPTLGATSLLTGDSDTSIEVIRANSEEVTFSANTTFDNLFDGGGSLSILFNTNSGIIGDGVSSAAIIDYDDISSLYGWSIKALASGGMLMFIRSSANYSQWELDTDLTEDITYHMVVTFDSSSKSNDPVFYIDGGLVALTNLVRSSTEYSDDNGASIALGNSASATRLYDGNLDEFCMFPTILSATEVRKLYWAGKGHRRYSLAVLADNPVSYWRLGESGTPTTAVDVLGTNDGTYTNTPTVGVTGPLVDDTDTAVTFASASSEYISVADTDDFSFTDGSDLPFSVEVWIKPITTGTSLGAIIGKAVTDVTSEWLFLINTDSKLSLVLYSAFSGSNRITAVAASEIIINNWYHVVGIYDGTASETGLDIFINGVLATDTRTETGTYVGMSNGPSPLEIGVSFRSETYYRYMNGSIDEPAIYDYKLTADQVLTHYLEGLSRQASKAYASQIISLSPVGYWRLGESGTPTTAIDQVGTNDGTYTNTPTVGVTGALTGDSNTAVTFTASSDEYITMGDVLDFDYNEPFSLECWFKTIDTSVNAMLMTKQSKTTPWGGYATYQKASGNTLVFILRNNIGNSLEVTLDTAFNDGNWHHSLVTYDGSSDTSGVTWYIDGVIEALTSSENTLTATTLTTYPFQIGNRNSDITNTWNGSIDEPTVYDYELSAVQAKQNYLAGTT